MALFERRLQRNITILFSRLPHAGAEGRKQTKYLSNASWTSGTSHLTPMIWGGTITVDLSLQMSKLGPREFKQLPWDHRALSWYSNPRASIHVGHLCKLGGSSCHGTYLGSDTLCSSVWKPAESGLFSIRPLTFPTRPILDPPEAKTGTDVPRTSSPLVWGNCQMLYMHLTSSNSTCMWLFPA